MTKEEDFTRILELEEEFVQKMCTEIIALKPDVVFTEKGVSDLAQHYLLKVDYTFNCRFRILNQTNLGWHYCYPSCPQV
jgi:T-complex protein 1 subunit gamma